MGERNTTALVSGAVFIVLGVLFLLDRLDIVRLGVSFVWPLLLIGLGAGILLGGRRRAPEADRAEEPSAADDEEEEEDEPSRPGSAEPDEGREDEDRR